MSITVSMKRYDELLEGWASYRAIRKQYDRLKTGEISYNLWWMCLEGFFTLHDANMQEIEQKYKED